MGQTCCRSRESPKQNNSPVFCNVSSSFDCHAHQPRSTPPPQNQQTFQMHQSIAKRHSGGTIKHHLVEPGSTVGPNGANGASANSIRGAASSNSFVQRTGVLANTVSLCGDGFLLKSAGDQKALAMFNKYKESDQDVILANGIEALCKDLDLRPDDFRILVLAWKCNVDRMCRFTKVEFVSGLRALKAESIKALHQRLTDMAFEVGSKPDTFKELYRFTFGFGLEPGQKVLPVEMAVSLWSLVFEKKPPEVLDRWIQFLQDNSNEIRGIPRDTWNMFLNFVETVGQDLASYDDTEAWPTLFDDFVECENDLANQNVTKDIKMKIDS